MKIQCPCGAKYSFDITPDMEHRPLHFVCSNCGLDASAAVNELVRQEIREMAGATAHPGNGAAAAAPVTATAPPPPDVAPPPPPPLPAAPKFGLRVRTHSHETESPSAQPAAAPQTQPAVCLRHAGQPIVTKCLLCQKPMCTQCMEMFGYVCSPLCRAKATSNGIDVPEYEGQRSVIEAKYWRKFFRIAGAISAVVVLLLGFWFWYAWFGSVPHVAFSTRFDRSTRSGSSRIAGTDHLIFLHGGTLARYQWKSGKQVWSEDIIDSKELTDLTAKKVKAQEEMMQEIMQRGAARLPHRYSEEELHDEALSQLEAALQLNVCGSNIWILKARKMTRYDWETGKPGQEITLPKGVRSAQVYGNELLFLNGKAGARQVTHLSLLSGESRVEPLNLINVEVAAQDAETNNILAATTATAAKALAAKPPAAGTAKPGSTTTRLAAASPLARKTKTAGGGLPGAKPGQDSQAPLDPNEVAAEAQRLPYAQRIALPATLSSAIHQQQINQALGETNSPPPEDEQESLADLMDEFDGFGRNYPRLIPTTNGFVQSTTKVLEEKFTSRNAMKDPPKKSALNGNATVGNSDAMANEILNEMQRNLGGSTVEQDESRYQVTVHLADKPEVGDFVGEIVGPPTVYPLKSVTVIAANKSVIVLDKENKKLWQATLTYNIPWGDPAGPDEAGLSTGEGPCVERGNMLFVFDEAVLNAFDLKTGSVAWRLPSVNIVGIFFDSDGMMYVNTTTGTVEKIKYSRQIDIADKTSAIVLKVDPKTGKVLWTAEPGGYIAHVSGKVLYTVETYENNSDPDNPYALPVQIPTHVTIQRIDNKKGRVAWVRTEMRCPLDVQFNGNTIEMVFRKEVEVLKFLQL